MALPTELELDAWVSACAALCQPDDVVWCDGSAREYADLCAQMVDRGTMVRLNDTFRRNSFLCRSEPGDVARVEDRTYICSQRREDAGPNNNWADPEQMRTELAKLFSGCMRGRTMYVVPYSMGMVPSQFARFGVEVTDSPYVVVNMHIMTRVGTRIAELIRAGQPFCRGLHSVGAPLVDNSSPDVPWPCNPENKYICHFPEPREIVSFGSGYGGNALLGKKCFGLRIASVIARDEGWLAEHMLILKITAPSGEVKYIAGAFPSACGKTNLAMLEPTIPGWQVQTVGDDIAWLRFGADGRLYAINPEAGFFGVAPGTSPKTNPNAIDTMSANTIFTNCALTPEGDVWWEDLTAEEPEELVDWLRRPWHRDCGRKAAHPNARFTTPAMQCPVLAPEWVHPEGVPISAILFGGRRAHTVPLVFEALSWAHGVFLGATMHSERTAAAAGKVGILRHDPMAMLPFCGYHMGDYFRHWLGMDRPGAKLPRVFHVNWFRKNAAGKFMWPGFGDNSRVLKWVFERCNDSADAARSPLGHLPTPESLDTAGLTLPQETLARLLTCECQEWLDLIPELDEHFKSFGVRLPQELWDELHALEHRLRKQMREE